MTRKQAHTEAVKMLMQAAALIDQAHAMAKDATTIDCIQGKFTRSGSMWVGLAMFSKLAESLAVEASDTVCDDCGLLIASCDCKWANEETN